MLTRLRGVLESIEENRATVVPDGMPGLAYEVLLPAYLADAWLGRGGGGPAGAMIGRDVTLHTTEYLESQGQGASFVPRVLGFSSAAERAFFELLTSVKGLGAKRGLRVMAVEPGVIARAIAERNGRMLQTLPEIGPKLAETIVHELKSKCDAYIGLGITSGASPVASAAVAAEPKPVKRGTKTAGTRNGENPAAEGAVSRVVPIRQTVDALVALGESPIDAERMVARAIDRLRGGGDEPPGEVSVLIAAAYAAR
jgi:Holliday junction DNA helicase RuvA